MPTNPLIAVPVEYLPHYITFPLAPTNGFVVIDPRHLGVRYRWSSQIRMWLQYNEDLPVLPIVDDRTGEAREMANEATRIVDGGEQAAATVPVRTREQQIRWMDLAKDYHVRPFTPAEIGEWESLKYMVDYIPGPDEAPIPRRDRISVRVIRTGNTYDPWTIEVKVNGVNRAVPKTSVVREFLDQADKAYIRVFRGRRVSNLALLYEALNDGLSPQALHDALKAWVIATISRGESATSETNLDDVTAHLLKVQPATLEVGGRVYKLVPAGNVDVRPLIARVRGKALAGAKLEAAGIKAKAATDAGMLITQANDKASAIQLQVKQELARLRTMKRVPEWVVNHELVHYWDGSFWNVEMKVGLKVTEIRLTVSEWGMTLYWAPLVTLSSEQFASPTNMLSVYFTLRDDTDGKYTMYEVHVKDSLSWNTCHISERACMELQGLPPRVNSYEELQALASVLTRGNRVINLSSPLSSVVSMYHPVFKAQIPAIPLRFLRHEVSFGGVGRGREGMDAFALQYPTLSWNRAESIQEEAEGVFNVTDPEPARIPVPGRG